MRLHRAGFAGSRDILGESAVVDTHGMALSVD